MNATTSNQDRSVIPKTDDQKNSSPSSSNIEDIEDLQDLNLEIPLSTKDVVVIAISGCTSSGKTSLALLVSEILRLGLGDYLSGPPEPAIIHQDHYFTAKEKCTELITFRPTKNDAEYVRASIGKGFWDQGEFKVPLSSQLRGKNANGGEECILINDEDDSQASSSAPAPIRSINTDTWDAMELTKFVEDLRLLRNTEAEGIEFRKNLITSTQASATINADPFLAEWKDSGIFKTLVTAVENWASNTCLVYGKPIPTLALVEGFLLYAKPPEDESNRDANHIKHEIAKNIDIKLMIPTSKACAEERRFSRSNYIDEAQGGTRVPGQMWKTEGYFEDVAWANYVKENSWMFIGNKIEGFVPDGCMEAKIFAGIRGEHNRIRILNLLDASMGFMMKWAISTILTELNKTMDRAE